MALLRGKGYTAQIERVATGVMVTIRDDRGHIVKRRTLDTRRQANEEAWRFLGSPREA